MKKRLSISHYRINGLILLTLTVILLSCQSIKNTENIIIIKGSESMHELNDALASNYMRTHPEIKVIVKGGGTEDGIRALTRSEVDIASASRELMATEVRELAENFQKIGVANPIAKDAIYFYVHPSNDISNIGIKQLKEILLGKIINWSELGFNDSPIDLIIRSGKSGTYDFLKSHLLNGLNYSTKRNM